MEVPYMSRANRDGTSKRVSPVRVYVTVVALATLPLAFFLIFAHNFLGRKVTQQVITQTTETGKLVSNLIDEEMEQRKLLLQSFSGRLGIIALDKDGHEFPVEISVSPVQVGSKYIFNAFLRDVTETKRAQRQIEEQNRQLEIHSLEVQRATRLKSDFWRA
jgi:hypothetical protein